MAERLNIELDGSEIVRGANEAVTALAELKAAFQSLVASTPKGQLQAQFAAVNTQAQLVADSVGKVFSQISTAVGKSLTDTEKTAKAGGKRVAKALAEGLDDGEVLATVKAQRQRLQSEYEAMVAMGGKVKLQALQNLKTMGVSLFPDDRTRLVEAQKLNSDFVRLYQADAAARVKAAKEAADAEQAQRLANTRANDRALADDLAGYKNMLRLRVEAQRVQQAANDKALADDLAGYKNMLRLRVEAEQAAAAQIAALRINGLAGTAKTQANAAVRAPDGTFSTLARANYGATVDPQLMKDEAAATMQSTLAKAEASKAAKALAAEEANLAARSQEVHAAFRGVAGAGGALFLTYGSLIPLTAAFFVTSAIKESIQGYKDFEYQLKFVQAVADDTTVTLDNMIASVTASAKAVGADPVEAAKGLRILAQAGLSTQESLNALPDILRLSTVGELGMAQAAETATGAVNAFGLGVDNIGHVVDVFYKSAAISNTSVASISESMKQASTIAQRYKLDVEDVGVALVALAKRNIVGSGAGTALTQMFNEMATPHGEGKKIASQLGITLFDPLKHDAKDFFDTFVPQLREKLKQFDPESQTYILNGLTNQRGAKALAAILGLSDEEIGQLKAKLNDATGSAARAVVELNDSVQGDLNKLKSAFQDTLQGAGAEGADSLRKSIQNLQAVIQSSATQDALGGMVAGLTLVLQGVTAVASAWASWDTVRKSLPLWVDPLGSIARLVGDIHKAQGDKGATDDAISGVESTIKKEREYQKALEDSIAKLREKLGLQGATDRAAASDITAQLKSAEQKMVLAQQDYNGATDGGKTLLRPGAVEARDALQVARAEFNRLASAQAALADSQRQTQQDRAALGALQQQAAAAQQAKDKQPFGTKHLNIPDAGAANSALSELRKQEELAASARKQAMSAEEEDTRHREAMLTDSYQRGTIDFASYQKQLEVIQEQASQRRIQELQQEKDALELTGPKLEAALQKARAAGSKTDIQRAANDMEGFRQKVEAVSLDIRKLSDKDAERLSDALTKALAPGTQMVKNSGKELELEKLNVDQELQKLAVKHNGAALSEKEAYVQGEILRISNAQVDTAKKYQAILSQMMADGAFDAATPETTAAWVNAVNAIGRAQAAVADTKARVSDAAAQAFDAAKVDKFAKELNTTLVDSIISAGHDGGQGLWKTLQNELIRKPLTVLLEGILQPVSQGVAQFVMGQGQGQGQGGSSSGTSTLGTIGNAYSTYNGASSLYTVGSQYMGGSMSGANALGTMYANATTTGSSSALDGLLSTNSAYGTASSAGGGGAGMGAMGAGALFFAVLAKVLMSEYQADKGDTRAGASFGFTPGKGVTLDNPTGVQILNEASGARPAGTDDAVKTLITGTSGQINDAFKAFGTKVSVSAFNAGWEASIGGNPNGNGRGGVFSGGTLSNGTTFGELGTGSNYDYTSPLDSKYELSGNSYVQTLLGMPGSPIDLNGSPDKLATDAQQAYIEALQTYAGITPRVVAQKATASQVGNFGSSDNSGFLGGLTSNIKEGDTIGWVRVFDQEMKDRAVELGLLPKKIMDLIVNVDPEALSKEASLELSTKISTMVANVNAFHAAVDEMPFGKLKDLSFDAAAGLVELAGGVDKLTAGLSGYYNNFYSDAEKRQNVAEQIQKQLSGVGIDLNVDQILHGTREQFRKLVEQFQGDGTDAGEKVYTTLLNVSDAFASITQQATSATDALNSQVQSLQDASKTFRDFQSSLTAFQKELNGPQLSMLSPEARYQQAKAEFSRLSALAPGNQERLAGLEGAGRELLGASQAYNASGGSYGTDLDTVKAAVAASNSAAQSAADLADQQLQIAQAQLDALNGIKDNTSQLAAISAQLNAMAINFDSIDTTPNVELDLSELQAYFNISQVQAQRLIDIADADHNGTISKMEATNANLAAILGVSASIQGNTGSVPGWLAAILGSSGAIQGNTGSSLDWLSAINGSGYAIWAANYNTQVALAAQAAAADYANTQATVAAVNVNTQVTAQPKTLTIVSPSGWSASLMNADAGVQPGGVTATGGSGGGSGWSIGGSFDVGTDYVPHDMLALIHQGEKITPAWDNHPYTPSQPLDLAPLVDAVGRLEDRLNQLTAVTAAGARGTIDGISQVADNTASSARAAALRASAAPTS